MRIDELLRASGGPVFSFEFGPPRTPEAELALWQAVEELRALDPAFVSVTWGAGGSTRGATLETVRRMHELHGLEAMPHLTCTGSTRAELRALVRAIAADGIDNLLALRGDPPRHGPDVRELSGAAELAALAAAEAGLCVVGACYPESDELDYVRAKVDAGVSVLITQLFFDNAQYLRFVDRLRAAGIDVPVLPGIVPVTNAGQLQRMASMCGASIPPALERELGLRADDPRAVADFGVAYATAQCAQLLAAGAPGIHLFTLNRSPATRAIVSALGCGPDQAAWRGAKSSAPIRSRSSAAPRQAASASMLSVTDRS
jgi:methylenetetrahydrofolate reductase (NADPH)